MLYNKLIPNRYRAQYARNQGQSFSEERCSGRSTAIALEAIAKAIRNPQQWVSVIDHYFNASQITHVNLAREAMDMADQLNLQFFERDRNLIRSCHMTPNQLELK